MQPGDYGKARTWASLTWTLLSPVAGLVNSRFGIRMGILCYAVGSACAIPTALALPVQALRKKVRSVRVACLTIRSPGGGRWVGVSCRGAGTAQEGAWCKVGTESRP